MKYPNFIKYAKLLPVIVYTLGCAGPQKQIPKTPVDYQPKSNLETKVEETPKDMDFLDGIVYYIQKELESIPTKFDIERTGTRGVHR